MKNHINHTIKEIQHYLPSQMTLKDFIHHNTLHPFQKYSFYEGIFRASKLFGYKVTLQLGEFRELFTLNRIKEKTLERIIIERKGKGQVQTWLQKLLVQEYDELIGSRIGHLRQNWKNIYKLDMDSLIHPTLFRLITSYLDQGISVWEFPRSNDGFLDSIRILDQNSLLSIFKTQTARTLLQDKNISVEQLLKKIVGDESYFEQYLFDLCFSHRGWSGLVGVIEDSPNILLLKRNVNLYDFIIVELLMEYDLLEYKLKERWIPLSHSAKSPALSILAPTPETELDDVLRIWQDAFEWSYYDDLIYGIQQNDGNLVNQVGSKKFQAVFCIDERECSLRRHLESVEPQCETFGAPGFFGVEFYFLQQGAKFKDKLCPAPVMPKYLIREKSKEDSIHKDIMFSKKSFGFLGSIISTAGLGLISIYKLFQILFNPKMSPSISDAFSHMDAESELLVECTNPEEKIDGLQLGFTIEEMTLRVGNFLRGIGLVNNFSDLIYIIAHGSSSANNPHHGAHDCGACSGRPGSVNSRVFCFMANHKGVRAALKSNGLIIPNHVQFIPAMHDTASDQIRYFDENNLNDTNISANQDNKFQIETALDLNAKERSRRFASIDNSNDIKKVRQAILDRSVSLFEPRPELGHGTNSMAIIGRRSMTRGLFLDRRAFLNSYDYTIDRDGKILANVMAPIGVVCGGINLEYYFSRVDNVKLGCGTKLPHNVVGLVGVTNSSDGDLRPGLPWQMIEPHDPVRLLVMVEHFPEIVHKVIQTTDAMYEWYKNEWVHIVVKNPETNEFFYFKDEEFKLYTTETNGMETIDDIHQFLEKSPGMKTNHITHATFENLPIYQLENNIKCI